MSAPEEILAAPPSPRTERFRALDREMPGFVAGRAVGGSCFACYRPIGEGGRVDVVYRDGRMSCAKCLATAVTRISKGRLILQDVSRVLRDAGGLDFDGGRWVRLELRSQEQLIASSGCSYAPLPWGSAGVSRDDDGSGATVYTVNVLYGLPQTMFSPLCAHELGHVYQVRHNFPKLDNAVMEGLCRLCEYVWLKRDGSTTALSQIDGMWHSENPVYGTGYRAAYTALRGRRLVALMEDVRRLGHLP